MSEWADELMNQWTNEPTARPDRSLACGHKYSYFLDRSMPRRHGTLKRQSTQSASSIQLGAFHTALSTSKKQRHYVLFACALWKLVLQWTQNHLVLGLILLFVLLCSCFFDFPALGIDGVLRCMPAQRTLASKSPINQVQKSFVHNRGNRDRLCLARK